MGGLAIGTIVLAASLEADDTKGRPGRAPATLSECFRFPAGHQSEGDFSHAVGFDGRLHRRDSPLERRRGARPWRYASPGSSKARCFRC